ncbi:hypothetical protein NDU88_004450 [Pleurodeles waltl]|uniref:Integrase catalytic domain-containing protein n=1 Tax=Pleurodeles waltl TaxID=8319 RepID=A0AAV7PF25_PLEWA|nr:hypothetical protein NDU88_004450 [Pleurodeles waltl]
MRRESIPSTVNKEETQSGDTGLTTLRLHAMQQQQEVRPQPADQQLEEVVRGCAVCQASGPPDPPVPVITEGGPTTPWERVSTDFRSLPVRSHMLVVENDYSRYPEVEIVHSTSVGAVIPKMKKLMATHGLFGEVRTDNRPPFNSREWAEFLRSRNTRHRLLTPRWLQANGEVEHFVKTLTKVVRIAVAESENVESSIYTSLREYRVMHHATTGVAPS